MNQKSALLLHAGVTLALFIVAYQIAGLHQALSVFLGSSVVAGSVAFMAWSMGRMLAKKSVALAGFVIVIKYLLLGLALYWLSQQPWVSVLWVGVGVASVVFTAVIFTLMMNDTNSSDEHSNES